MKLDKSSLLLYLVTDRSWHSEVAFMEKIEESLKNGTTFLQLREKDIDYDLFLKRALEMKKLANQYKVPLIINDDAKVAVDSGADGIHIGQGDMEVTKVRALIGEQKILGVSVGTVEQAIKAEREGADYLGVGAVFPTGTKKDANAVEVETLKDICRSVDIPVVAIGGIDRTNINKLQGAGIVGVAVISAILDQKNIDEATTDLKRLCGQLMNSAMPKILTIAGSDCSGGAGIQADLKTMAAHGCYGMSVITALTAQNTMGVYGIENCSPEFVENQIDCIFTDIVPDAVKVGMVSSAEIIKSIAGKLAFYRPNFMVVDPVMVSTSGSKLLDEDALEALCKDLLPLATLITPNISEAEILCGFEIKAHEDMVKAAEKISSYFKGYILIKGGHLKDTANDLLFKDGKSIWFESERIDNENTHGTGCTLSSAIASHLAIGYNVEESVKKSKSYITGALENGMNLGLGNGPLNHMYTKLTGEN